MIIKKKKMLPASRNHTTMLRMHVFKRTKTPPEQNSQHIPCYIFRPESDWMKICGTRKQKHVGNPNDFFLEILFIESKPLGKKLSC